MPRIQPNQLKVGDGPQNSIVKYGVGPEYESEATRLKDDGVNLTLSGVPLAPVYRGVADLTDAQIKTLPTSPVTIVPAPGEGQMVLPIGGFVWLDNQEGVYVLDGDPIWQLVYVSSPFPKEASGFIDPTGAFLAPGLYSAPIPSLSSYNAVEGYLSWGLTGDANERVNTALAIADVYNGVPNYTGGNVANSLRVTVVYTVIDA